MLYTPGHSLIKHMQELRRTLHRCPELSYREKKTAAVIAAELDRLGIPYSSAIAGTGIVAELEGKYPGRGTPCVALRADMDGLPIQEETGLAFSSEHPGCMHACGHDGHMAMLLGAAALLKGVELPGRVKFFFQPAEESGNGAEKMIEAGVLDDVGLIFAGHVDVHYPVGTLTVDDGLVCSYTDPFTIHIHGRGGHAAWPHEAVDSIVVASNLIMNMQTLVSREVDPVHPAVVTVGRVQAGTVHNVIAEQAVIDGTVRSAHPETRSRILSGLNRMIQGTAAMSGARIELRFLPGLPAVINTGPAVHVARQAALAVVGAEGIASQGRPSLGGEDFAFYQQKIPGCLIRFGAQKADSQSGQAHSSRFDFDEGVVEIGSSWLAHVAVLGLKEITGR